VFETQKRFGPDAGNVEAANHTHRRTKYTKSGISDQDRIDTERERRIEFLSLELRRALGTDEARSIWIRLANEISQRSSGQIRRLEAERGLLSKAKTQALPNLSIAEHSMRSDSWHEPEWEC
jgi:hypothetical protein